MFIPEIDRLLKIDEENVSGMRQLFFNFDSDLPETLNQAVTIYHACTRAFSQGLGPHLQPLADCLKAMGVSAIDELKKKLAGPIPPGQEEIYKSCSTALDEFYARQNRAALLSRLGVLYGMAVADFLRVRFTAPLAYIRLQCESLAFIKLMREEPAVARAWLEIFTEEQGRDFYRTYQRRIKAILASYDLAFAYDQASAVALHVRFAGVAFGLRVSNTIEGNRGTQRLETLAQEFDPANPSTFLLQVLYSLRVQERIFSALSDCVPEIRDLLLLETRIPQFRAMVDGLFERFARRHPDLMKRFRQAVENLSVAG